MLKRLTIVCLILALLFSFGWSAKTKPPTVENPVEQKQKIQVTTPGSVQPIEQPKAVTQPASPVAFDIPWLSVNAGGDMNMSSTNFKIKASAGQSVIGSASSANYGMGIGFWYGAAAGPNCVAKPGDANGDNTYSLADVIATVNYIFKKAGWPACPVNDYTCWLYALACRGDWNALDAVTLADVIRAVNYIFKRPGWPACPANDYTCWLPPASGVCCLSVP